ncbi:hypothetical protein K6W12_27255 [Burkholderia multivorans]|uniref:4'-phosphopantetheinyl transferase family protein n=1 Tax=Burkholderia multivorans TaxID=87883 RepID=UPI001C93E696|nr:hypothetical protein [Burkholderia multivorans]MBY4674325.1 hypothetical protein [Burkholderia multivorans]
MLTKADVDHAEPASYPTGPIRGHPVFQTLGLDFVPQPPTLGARPCRDFPASGNLILWRVRAEWHGMRREEGLPWLSPVERERAKHHPNPALAKRYQVGRATLRCILSGMLGCSPGAVDLVDGSDRQPRLRGTEVTPAIHVAYAGNWILIGISATGLGLGTVVPVAGWDRPGGDAVAGDPNARVAAELFPDIPTVGQWAQQRARRESVYRLASSHDLGTKPAVVTQYGAASMISSPDGRRYQILDLPMPGRIAAAVALAGKVSRVDAFGWVRD